MTMRYKGYNITYNPKPIPVRRHDWDFVHDDYNGPGDVRCGSAANAEDAKTIIDDIESDLLDTVLNVPFRFGLEAQGHIPTIRAMLQAGKPWAVIAAKIGWEEHCLKSSYLQIVVKQLLPIVKETLDKPDTPIELLDACWMAMEVSLGKKIKP